MRKKKCLLIKCNRNDFEGDLLYYHHFKGNGESKHKKCI